MENKLHTYFPEDERVRGITKWGDCGTIVGRSASISLICSIGKTHEIGGSWLFKKDKDEAIHGIHPQMITICRECPINCKK